MTDHEFLKIRVEDIENYSPLEVLLKQEDDFLKIKETLTRIGVASKKDNTLYQSCHILHKQGRYFIVHFKELFILDGKTSNLQDTDVMRRNTIACLLEDWGLLTIVNSKKFEENTAPISQIKIISFSDKDSWILSPKYNIGKKK